MRPANVTGLYRLPYLAAIVLPLSLNMAISGAHFAFASSYVSAPMWQALHIALAVANASRAFMGIV